VVGSAPNDRLRSSVYASKGELSFKISGLAQNMQAKNSRILPTPAKPTAGRRDSALEMGNMAIELAVVSEKLCVPSPNQHDLTIKPQKEAARYAVWEIHPVMKLDVQ
jgi:hypothetical protein